MVAVRPFTVWVQIGVVVGLEVIHDVNVCKFRVASALGTKN